jgi:serine phosphatase RsbU (regulator of sigma subunit)/Tfp pilus assembly protein PilF
MKSQTNALLRLMVMILILSISLCSKLLSQDRQLTDSLRNALTAADYDTNKVKLFIELGELYRNSLPDTAFYYYHEALAVAENIKSRKFIVQTCIVIGANLEKQGSPDSALVYLEKALRISNEIGDKEKISTSLLNLGIVYHDQGSYDKAIEHYQKSLEMAEEINFKKGISRSLNNLGRAYFDQGSYEKSIDSYLESAKMQEELGDLWNLAACYNNIGLVHVAQGTYDKAIEYLEKALEKDMELSNKRSAAICYLNIGMVRHKQGSYDKAFEGYDRALRMFEEIGDKRGISECNHNLGALYLDRGLYARAAEHYLRALYLYEEMGDKRGIALLGVNIARLNVSLADSVAVTGDQRASYLSRALLYGNKSLANAREMSLTPTIKEAADILMTAHYKLGNYKKAAEYAQVLIAAQDSMFRQEKTRAIEEMSTRYETEKKQQQIELQESQLIAKDARIKQQRTFRNALIGGLAAIAAVIVVIAYAYRQKRKDNRMILEKNEQILRTNEELKQLYETASSQKEEIISSINYAQRIQSAILPSEGYITELLNEHFILYKPKEIVSGDFYWIKQVKHYIILVSADCTGHGVPGALMSMLGISFLNEIVQRREITQADHVLNELRKQIKHSLRQSGKREESREGIDIALCVIDTRKNVMQYSGANNPLYIISNSNGESVLKEIKADMMPVGVHFSSDKPFTNHEIKLEIGDIFYIFSDGYMDQIGEGGNARFTSTRFKKLLLEIHDQPMYEQKEILEHTLTDWMGTQSQRDDILVMGARV